MSDEIKMTGDMPKVSVIVPIYNAEQHLRRCIDSILGQSYRNIEVIMIDDGSTDGSAGICREYCESDPRCSYFYRKNSGPDGARKEGVLRSTGEYLVFADADDYILQDMILTMYSECVKQDVGVVCCEIKRFSDTGKVWDEKSKLRSTTRYETMPSKMRAFFEERVLRGSYWAKLIRRDVLSDYEFTDNTLIGEDISAALYIISKDIPIVMIPESFYMYYWNLESISHSEYCDRHRNSLINYIDKCDKLVAGHYIDDSSVYGFFAEREMAVATAMGRGKVYDRETVSLLRDHMRSVWRYVLKNRYTALYMKLCIAMYIFSPSMFLWLYRGVYLLTGR